MTTQLFTPSDVLAFCERSNWARLTGKSWKSFAEFAGFERGHRMGRAADAFRHIARLLATSTAARDTIKAGGTLDDAWLAADRVTAQRRLDSVLRSMRGGKLTVARSAVDAAETWSVDAVQRSHEHGGDFLIVTRTDDRSGHHEGVTFSDFFSAAQLLGAPL